LVSILTIWATQAFSQKGPHSFGEPILTDSLSIMFIPSRYTETLFTSNKLASWGNYYANILVYDFKKDTYKKLFEKDTFIEAFTSGNTHYSYSSRTDTKIKNLTADWVFLLVKTKDTNKSGRIDEKDASVLFAVSTKGDRLKQLTEENECVESFTAYEKQGFVLIKVQRDSDNDGAFKSEDKNYYLRKLSLKDLSWGNAIEVN
jgi:hypothetical protein